MNFDWLRSIRENPIGAVLSGLLNRGGSTGVARGRCEGPDLENGPKSELLLVLATWLKNFFSL